MEDVVRQDPYNDILGSLLGALKWKGQQADIIYARPYGIKFFEMSSFLEMMANLGYSGKIRNNLFQGHGLTYPALGISDNGQPILLMSGQDLKLSEREFSKFITFRPINAPLMPVNGTLSVQRELRRFGPLLREVSLISILIGGIGLAPIFFNHALFDHVIASGSMYGLPMLVAGVLLALSMEIFLRERRNKRLAEFGGRIDHFVSCGVFERLLFLPPAFTEQSAVSAQLARLKDFENVREFFTGPLATLFFEIPLILVYLTVMACMTQWLALIPLTLLGAYAILLTLTRFKLSENTLAATVSASRRQEFLMETISKMHDIRAAGMEDVWNKRYQQISSTASLDSFKSGYSAQFLETCSYILMNIGGVATLGFGVVSVIAGNLTVGALIAAMMLVWRIIAPMQICCASISRIQQLQSSVRQVKRLLSISPEHKSYTVASPIPRMRGKISFNRVSLRYAAESDPALLGVSFNAEQGQVIAISGANGSGKSTILKVVLGLYRPQNGSVRIDDIDIRQFDPVAIRQMISYIPQNLDLFSGTIRDNLLLTNPVVTDEQIWQALEDSVAADEVRGLSAGLDTLVEGEGAETVSFLLKQRFNLARAYLRPSPIMLFDEASHSLGYENDLAFERKINELRGGSTILLVTHREDHMHMADQLLVMNKGELTHAGPPEKVLTALRGR